MGGHTDLPCVVRIVGTGYISYRENKDKKKKCQEKKWYCLMKGACEGEFKSSPFIYLQCQKS